MDEDLTVRDIMSREFVGVSESDTIAEVASIMDAEKVSGVIVMRGSSPVGLTTDRLLLFALTTDEFGPQTAIREVMGRPEPAVAPNLSIDEAIAILSTGDVDHIIVSNDEDEPIGLVTTDDIVLTAASLIVNDQPQSDPIEAMARQAGITESDDYSTQSVCEVCGSFAPDLQDINGQLICGDCRRV